MNNFPEIIYSSNQLTLSLTRRSNMAPTRIHWISIRGRECAVNLLNNYLRNYLTWGNMRQLLKLFNMRPHEATSEPARMSRRVHPTNMIRFLSYVKIYVSNVIRFTYNEFTDWQRSVSAAREQYIASYMGWYLHKIKVRRSDVSEAKLQTICHGVRKAQRTQPVNILRFHQCEI